MTEVLLVAASGLAREALAVLDARGERAIGVLDDDPARHGATIGDGVPVLGGLDLVREHPDAALLVCAGRGVARRAIVERLATLDVDAGRFATLVHPDVRIPASCRVGVGSVLLAGVVLTADVRLGDHVVVMPNVTMTHDDVVADYATLTAGVSLAGDVVVGAAAYLGMNAAVREHVRIGAGATVGMGAAVLTDVPAGETWAGVPARRLTRPPATNQDMDPLEAGRTNGTVQ